MDPGDDYECFREDKADLIKKWLEDHGNGSRSAVVKTLEELEGVKADETDYLLGLFAPSHLPFDHMRNHALDPSIADMTAKALEILTRNQKGFFLMVEGGRIDHAHHDTKANRALLETIAMDQVLKTIRAGKHCKFTIKGDPSRDGNALRPNV